MSNYYAEAARMSVAEGYTRVHAMTANKTLANVLPFLEINGKTAEYDGKTAPLDEWVHVAEIAADRNLLVSEHGYSYKSWVVSQFVRNDKVFASVAEARAAIVR